uniref:Uncharacterized protein n=1 Tax=Arundo donax TaxID=35708 RepID=A0A0A9HM89_ARUDO
MLVCERPAGWAPALCPGTGPASTPRRVRIGCVQARMWVAGGGGEDPPGMGHDLLAWSVSMLPLVPTMQPAATPCTLYRVWTVGRWLVGVAT